MIHENCLLIDIDEAKKKKKFSGQKKHLFRFVK